MPCCSTDKQRWSAQLTCCLWAKCSRGASAEAVFVVCNCAGAHAIKQQPQPPHAPKTHDQLIRAPMYMRVYSYSYSSSVDKGTCCVVFLAATKTHCRFRSCCCCFQIACIIRLSLLVVATLHWLARGVPNTDGDLLKRSTLSWRKTRIAKTKTISP